MLKEIEPKLELILFLEGRLNEINTEDSCIELRGDYMITRKLREEEIFKLQKLVPEEWCLDIGELIKGYYYNSCFYPMVVVDGEEIVAAGNLFIFEKSAWLGQILVDKAFRRRGIGTMIMKALIRYAEDRGIQSINLVASKEGALLYKTLGFKEDGCYQFYKGLYEGDISPYIQNSVATDIEVILKMDYRVTAEARKDLLEGKLVGGYKYLDDLGEVRGVFLPAYGHGLVLALDGQAGTELIKFKHFQKEALTIIPDRNREGIAFLKQMGFELIDQAKRMYLGEYTPWTPEKVFGRGSAYAG